MMPLARRAAVGAFAAVVTLGLTALPAGAASEWDLDFAGGTLPISSFGHPATATYGQTFTVPEGPRTLGSFSIEVTLPSTVRFRAVLQAWDPAAAHATGVALYTSAPMSVAGTGTETLTFSPDVAITPGVYVIYLTASYDWADGTGVGTFPSHQTDPYPGGQFVYLNNNGTGTDPLTHDAWTLDYSGYDLGFTVLFDVATPPTAPPAPPVTGSPAFTG